jgi:diaminohydroxyphosphoribosylaminopyrimidine deaminase/5-amino-6-(5-phosphoribosylamino)uracil reductase
MSADRRFMRRVLRLAGRGSGCVSPNPLVGAVLVKDGVVVAEGWHHTLGGDHAEIDALKKAGDAARGADLYVNLEPCCHFGRTPPCTRALIAAGIRRVVVAHIDPNPLVAGQGVAALRAAGLEVEVGVLEAEARDLNAAFLTWITTGRPYVILKMAMTLDGRTADREGYSRWVSSDTSRREVHRMRARADAVMVGAGTALRDDPLLLPVLVRPRRRPIRVVVDGAAALSLASRLATTTSQSPVLIAATDAADEAHVAALRGLGVEVVRLPATDGRVDPEALLAELGRRQVGCVLVEGGPTLAAGLLARGLVDRIVLFVAPRLLGDPAALSLVGDLGIRTLPAAQRWAVQSLRRCGPDVRIDLVPQGP